jgi:hypothetical protein
MFSSLIWGMSWVGQQASMDDPFAAGGGGALVLFSAEGDGMEMFMAALLLLANGFQFLLF